jgi:predicted 3-demethylubiquinone-9 3-methyltransferase (glyoxalase superfamily)
MSQKITTFLMFASRYAWLADRSGVSWQLSLP